MDKYVGVIARTIRSTGDHEVVKFPFVASDWNIANDFVESLAQDMPTNVHGLSSNEKYHYDTYAEEQ